MATAEWNDCKARHKAIAPNPGYLHGFLIKYLLCAVTTSMQGGVNKFGALKFIWLVCLIVEYVVHRAKRFKPPVPLTVVKQSIRAMMAEARSREKKNNPTISRQ